MRKPHAAIAAMTAASMAAALSTVITLAPSASAASLTQITNFGNNPTGLSMYEYVPANVSAHPPLLVVLHYCSGSAQSMYTGTEFASLADRYGFMEIYPQVNNPSNDCWDVSSDGALTHNGNSDPAGIMSMIQYAEAHNNVDASRIYVTGASSGGMMTEVMLGDYPDVFKAGSDFEGVPFHCFYTGTVRGWNSACAQGQVSNTPQVWGDYVRAADPGYTGPRPRVQLWHGTADATVNYNNFGELIKQWTNVFGVSQTPSSTATINGSWTHTTYGDANNPDVDAYSIAGVGHTLPLTGMAAVAIHFFGLDGSGSTTSASPSASASASPSASATGTGAAAACKVTNVVSAWNTGLTNTVTVTNTSNTPINGWTLTFTLASGQVVTSAWNATINPTSGAVTASNMSYNAAIPAGGTASFGYQANHTGNTTVPTGFALNGTACTSS